MEKVLETFKVKYLQILNEKGIIDKKLMPKLTNSQIKSMYEFMILTRVFDEKALKLQRQGRIGTYAPTKGQEACQIGSAFALKKDDFVFPAFRENGVYMYLGYPIHMLYQYWGGDERGMNIPKNINIAPVSITVGAHPPHAVGMAYSFKYKKKKSAVLTYFGDGATSEGDFHTALNFAGVLKTPSVFICNNNQYAISVPVKEQTASSTLAQKAIAYGFEGIKVDGNDIFAVYYATKKALEKARSGKGPTLIELETYRLGDHTTSDDAKKYRAEKEVKKHSLKDPILRLEKYMFKNKLLNKKSQEDILKKSQEKVEQAVKKYESLQKQNPEDIFNYTYDKLPLYLEEQKQELLDYLKEHKDLKKQVKKTKKGGAFAVGELEES